MGKQLEFTVGHIGFRLHVGDDITQGFELFAPESASDRALFTGFFNPALPGELRTLADAIEALVADRFGEEC